MSSARGGISRRDFLRVAGLSLAGAGLSACGAALSPPGNGSSKAVELVYQDWRTEWFPPMARQMLAIFNEQHPGIQAFYISDPENLKEQMLEDFAAGTAPDVLSGCCEFFPAWATAGYLLDLRPYVEADLDDEMIRDWSPAQYQSLFTRDGKQFGLPKYHGGLALYYNKDLFDEAGVDYPNADWDHDKYLAAMKELTGRRPDGTQSWGSMFDVAWERIQMHVNGWGGHFVNPEDPTDCAMSDPPAQEAMEWLRARIWEDKVMPTSLDVQSLETREAFIEQRIAMVEDGSWALRDILDRAQFRVDVAPFPAGPKKKVTLATTDGFAIYAGTEHPDAAWELLKFLTGKEYGRAMARDHLLQPARLSLVPEWVEFIHQAYPRATKEMDIAAFADGQIKGYSVVAETFANMVGVGEIAEEVWDQIFTFGNQPVSAMGQACEQIEAIQKSSAGLPAACGCQTGG